MAWRNALGFPLPVLVVLAFAGASACGAEKGGPEATGPASGQRVPDSVMTGEADTAEQSATDGDEAVVAIPEGKHRIGLFRPSFVGERARVKRTVTDLTTERVSQNGKQVKNVTLRRHVLLEGVAETLSINGARVPVRTRYVVERFEAGTPEGMRPVVAPGTVLTIQRGDEKQQSVTSDKGALTAEQIAAVNLAVSLRIGRDNDQRIFAGKEPRSVGESWPINSELGRASMEEEGVGKLRSLGGNSTLVAERDVDGIPCLEVMSRMEGDIETLPDLPPDTTVVRGKLRARLSGLFPKDPKQPALLKTSSMTFEITTRTKTPEGIVEVNLNAQRDGEFRVTPMK